MELLPSDEEEVHAISSGLDSQTEQLETRVHASLIRGRVSLCVASLAAATALASDRFGEAWRGETSEARMAFYALGAVALSYYSRGAWDYSRAWRKRRLSSKLQKQVEEERWAVY